MTDQTRAATAPPATPDTTPGLDDALPADVASADTPPAAPPVDATEAPAVVVTAEARAPGGVSAEVEVDCPGCGLTLVGEAPRPTAAWFCPRCDYPLFWASEPPPAAPGQSRARRRLPGTGGTVVLGAEACWHCGEKNEPDTSECRRCAARLPKPAAPVVTIHERVPVAVPVMVRASTWPFVAAGISGGAAIAAAVAFWVAGVT